MTFKRVIYLDVDNTIFPAEKRLVEIWNKQYRLPTETVIDYKTITDWDCGIPKEISEEIFSRIDFYDPSKISFYDGCIKELKKAKNRGYKIIVFSKGTLTNIASKAIWLENSELYPLLDGHVFMGSKEVKMGKSSLNMEGSIIIDDHIDNLKGNNVFYSICAKLTKQEVSWNKDWLNENLTIRKWEDLTEVLDRIETFESLMYYNNKKQ